MRTGLFIQKIENYQNICEVNDLSIKGEHNIQNSLAVINVAMNIGIDPNVLKEALKNFQGC